MKKRRSIIFIIALVTILTRFVGLDKVPPHLSNDEISIAYDAYSISETLRDEHNHFMPISFESHGTHKAPLTIYLTSLSIKLLGNSDFSARLPSAIFGSLTVLVLGSLVYLLSSNMSLSLVSGGVLAISPWHIYTSRMALETNVALFFLASAIYLFFLAENRKKDILFLPSFLAFSLSMYAYHTEWGLTPLIIIVLGLIYRKNLMRKKAYFIGLLIFVLTVIPLLTNFINNLGTNARANTEFLLTQDSLKDQLSLQQGNYTRQGQIILSRFVATYSSYIEPDKIFFASPNLLPKTNPFQAGLILAPFLPAFLFGLFGIKKHFKNHAPFIYLWLFICPVVPALTVGEQQVVRNLPFLLPALLVTAVGCCQFYKKFGNNKTAIGSYSFLILVSFFYFSIIYYYHYPIESGVNFQYGYKQIAEYIKPRYGNFDKIVIDPIFGEGYVYTGVPHLYIPYYTALDPRYLQERGKNVLCGNCFDKYEIRSIDWENEPVSEKTLYVVPDSNKPSDVEKNQLNVIYEVYLPNRKPAFAIYEKI